MLTTLRRPPGQLPRKRQHKNSLVCFPDHARYSGCNGGARHACLLVLHACRLGYTGGPGKQVENDVPVRTGPS